ncbi:MAG: hypothetical protein ABIO64_09390 [Burkholderiaceae bacterium]
MHRIFSYIFCHHSYYLVRFHSGRIEKNQADCSQLIESASTKPGAAQQQRGAVPFSSKTSFTVCLTALERTVNIV